MGVRRYPAGGWTAGRETAGVRRYRYWLPLAALALLLAAGGTCGLRAPAPAWAQSPPPAAVNGVTVDNIQATSARLNVSLTNKGSLTTTLYVRTRTPADNATWNGPFVRFITASTTATRTITGLIAGAKYSVEVSTSHAYAAADTKGAAFTTTGTVAIIPNPGTAAIHRLHNHEFSVSASAGVQNVTITGTAGTAGTAGTGDVTLGSAEAGLNCNKDRSLSIASSGSFWLRGCTAGTLTLGVAGAGNSAVSASYTVTILDAQPSVSAGGIGHDSATATAAVSNPDGVGGTVYLRYRTAADSGAWTLVQGPISGGVSVSVSLPSLDAGAPYRLEASTSYSFPSGSTQTAAFTTLEAPAVSGLAVGGIDETGAIFTATVAHGQGVTRSVYFRYRTTPSGAWSAVHTGSGTESVSYSVSSLAADAGYEVQAAMSVWFTGARSAAFTTLVAPGIGSLTVTGITPTGAAFTAVIADGRGLTRSVYFRYRTTGGNWSAVHTEQTTLSAGYGVSSLAEGAEHQVQASLGSAFAGGVRSQDFRTTRSEPTLGVSFSPSSDVDQGTAITVTMELGGVAYSANSGITFRLQVAGPAGCEGTGMGSSRSMSTVDEDPEVRTATIADTCPAGFHATELRVYDGGALWVSASRDFVVRSPPVPPPPTPIPDGRDVVSGAHAYLGTVHIVVGSPGSDYGYAANGEGGLTAGRLPDELFVDGTARPAAEITVSSSSELKLRYTDVEAGRFLSGDGLRWLRVRLRAQDNTVIGGANLWDASSCGGQSICVGVGATLAAHDAKAVGVDFFDAAAEALDSAPGGRENILIVAESTGTDATGFDQSSGEWIAGGFPSEWFEDGSEKLPERIVLAHGAAGRRLELHYGSSETTGQWKYAPPAYRTHRLVLRDRDGTKVLEWPMQDALEAMSEDGRRCGDASAARRLCLDYYDDGLDPALYRGQVMLLQVEDVTWYAMLKATPGGPVGGQLLLGLFGAMMFGWRFRATRSPQREWIILAAGAVSSVLLPVFGFGSLFWGGAILIIAALAAAGWFFVTRAR